MKQEINNPSGLFLAELASGHAWHINWCRCLQLSQPISYGCSSPSCIRVFNEFFCIYMTDQALHMTLPWCIGHSIDI